MSTNKPEDQEATEIAATNPQGSQAKGRRRFLGAGAVATSTLLTLTSQPALGGTCFTPSRSLSKNTSLSQNGQYGECNGISPGNYKAQTDSSSAAYHWPIPPSTPFHPTFTTGSKPKQTLFVKTVNQQTVSMSMLDVLKLQGPGTDPNQVAFHIIGAYLNALNGYLDSHITSSLIQTIWSEYATKGYFEPFAGTRWYGADIVTYLTENTIAP